MKNLSYGFLIALIVVLSTACGNLPGKPEEMVTVEQAKATVSVTPTSTSATNTPTTEVKPGPPTVSETPVSTSAALTLQPTTLPSGSTSTPVVSGVWRVENIEAEKANSIKLASELSIQSQQKIQMYFRNPVISPDSKRLLIEKIIGYIPCYEGSKTCYYPEAELWLYDFALGQWQKLVGPAAEGAWSPDGNRIVYLAQVGPGDYELQYLTVTNNVTRTITSDIMWAQPYWRNNEYVVYLAKDNYVTQIKLDSTDKRQLSSVKVEETGGPSKFALSADGKSLAMVNNRKVWIINLETTQSPIPLEPKTETGVFVDYTFSNIVDGIAWSPNGQYLAFAAGDHFISIYDKNGNLISNISVGQAPHALNWSPDNSSIAAIGSNIDNEGNYETFVVIANIDGSKSVSFEIAQENKYTLAWSPNGAYMVWGMLSDSPKLIPPVRLNLKIR